MNYSRASNIATQYYMSGTIGYTGTNGNTAAQVIASLQSAAAADGTRPAGTIYFEDNGDIRSTTREGAVAGNRIATHRARHSLGL